MIYSNFNGCAISADAEAGPMSLSLCIVDGHVLPKVQGQDGPWLNMFHNS